MIWSPLSHRSLLTSSAYAGIWTGRPSSSARLHLKQLLRRGTWWWWGGGVSHGSKITEETECGSRKFDFNLCLLVKVNKVCLYIHKVGWRLSSSLCSFGLLRSFATVSIATTAAPVRSSWKESAGSIWAINRGPGPQHSSVPTAAPTVPPEAAEPKGCPPGHTAAGRVAVVLHSPTGF